MRITPIEPGDAHRYYCEDCSTEYEIQLEPKVAEMQTKPKMDRLQFVPFAEATHNSTKYE